MKKNYESGFLTHTGEFIQPLTAVKKSNKVKKMFYVGLVATIFASVAAAAYYFLNKRDDDYDFDDFEEFEDEFFCEEDDFETDIKVERI